MKTGSIQTKNLPNDNYFQFMTQIHNLISGIGAEKLKITKQFTQFQTIYAKVDEALKKINKSALTEQIQIADSFRDDSCIGIVEMNRAMLRHYDPKKREAAKRLKIVFDTFGNISGKPLNAQTSAVYNLLQELQGKYSEDTKLAGIFEWTAKLKEQNDDFEKIMTERFEESASKSSIILRDVRKELDGVYKNICEIINACVLMDGAENYEKFIKMQNEIVRKYGGKKTTSSSAETTSSGDNTPATPPKEEASQSADGGEVPSFGGVAGASSPDGVVKPWNAAEDYTKMKLGDRRQTADGRIWEAIDLGQVHRDPTGEHGHFGWKLVG